MKKILAVLLVCACLLSAFACAETLTCTDRSITLPEGYVLKNAAETPGVDTITDAAGNTVMEMTNTGNVGGDHSQLAPMLASTDAQFASELSEAGYTEGYDFGMRQYSGRLFIGAFAQKPSGEPAARIITINDAGNLIDIWSYLDKAVTEQLLNSLGPSNPISELPQQGGRRVSKVNSGSRIGQSQNQTASNNTIAALPTIAPMTQATPMPTVPLTGDVMSATRIHEELGVFNFNELTNVKSVKHSAAAQTQLFRVNLENEVYVGGSEGYWDEWRTSTGILSEIQFDWDSDGAAEYVLLYVKEEPGEYDVEQNMYLAVYESAGDGWIKADECYVMNHRGSQERYVRLLWGDKPRFAVGRNMVFDGGFTSVTNDIYSYNGSRIVLDVVSEASSDTYSASFAVEGQMGPMDIRMLRKNVSDDEFLEVLSTEQMTVSCDGSGSDSFGHAEHIEQIAGVLANYGLNISVVQHDEYYCEVTVDGGDIFWYSMERFTDGSVSGDEAYVDVRLFSQIDHGFGGKIAAPQKKESAAETQSEPTHVLILADVNVRSGPGTNYNKINSAKNGSKLEYLGETASDDSGNSWLKISIGGAEGWVSGNYAELVTQ